ncbi:MAG: hypothetical protein IPO08_18410 [Xanthomonadales bacterium]|nr:hypothetical protein [Xanthomonadales bacterium]
MNKLPKYLWAVNAVVAGLIGQFTAPIVMRYGGSHDVAMFATGVLGYMSALMGEHAYILLSEHYSRCRRSRRAARFIVSRQQLRASLVDSQLKLL